MLDSFEKADPCLHRIPVDTEIVESAVAQYAVAKYYSEDTIRNAYLDFDYEYESYVESRNQQREAAENTWNTNRYLTRAAQFADSVVAKPLNEARTALLCTMDARITEALEKRAEAEAEREAAYRQHLSEVNEWASEKYREAYEKRHNDYVLLCRLMENIQDVRKMGSLILNFEELGDYLDCAERASQCKQEVHRLVNETQQKREQAQAQEHQKYVWRKKGVCQHCGGAFKGVIGRKCSVCGVAKDY